MEQCSVNDCDRPVKNQKRQLCERHYQRWRKHGDVHNAGKFVRGPVEEGFGITLLNVMAIAGFGRAIRGKLVTGAYS